MSAWGNERTSRAAPQGMGRHLNHSSPGVADSPRILNSNTRSTVDSLGGRALFPAWQKNGWLMAVRRFLPGRFNGSRAHLPGLRARAFYSIGSVTRAGLLNFDTSPKPASNPRRVGADAFHGSNHRSIHVSEIAQVVSGTTHEYRG